MKDLTSDIKTEGDETNEINKFMITLASASVTKNLLEDSFALIFGVNTLCALIVQNILTVVFGIDIGLVLSFCISLSCLEDIL